MALLALRTRHQAWRSIADYGALRSWGAAVASPSVVMNNVEMWFIRRSSLFNRESKTKSFVTEPFDAR